MTALKEPSVQKKKPRKQVVIDHPTQPGKPLVLIEAESPETKRARLLAELAELNKDAPTSATGPLGPNYWAMSSNTLKTLCISKGIVDRTGQRESMIASMQSEDMKAGLQPHPRENEQSQSGIRAGNTPVHVEPHTRDAVRIIDSDGNEYAIVKRIGRMLNGNPVLLDMDGNAQKIAAALNEGRFTKESV